MRRAGLVLLLLLMPSPAFAALGGDQASIDADVAQMKGTRTVTSNERYVIHEIVLPSGTSVREYVSAGRVCAVAWRGPWLPDMRILLGTYFDQYSRAARHNRSSHRPFAVDEPGLVVHAGGHMRAFFGEAHVPALLPAGASVEELR
jgi:hypothetical protein